MKNSIETATHLSDFFFERLASQLDINSIDGRARLVTLAKPLLTSLPDSVFRQLMVERLAELAHTSTARVAGPADDVPGGPDPRPSVKPPAAQHPGQKSPVRQAIELLLYQPSLATDITLPATIGQCSQPGVPLLIEIIELLQQATGT